MKKYLIILSILFLCSCESIFRENDNEYFIVDKEQEKIDLLNGIYFNLAQVHNEDYFKMLGRSDDVMNKNIIHYEWEHPQGRISGSCGDPSLHPEIDYELILGNAFKKMYTGIITINSMLEELSDSDDAEIVGELYFLRAYSYFKLARIFGRPPLVLDICVDYFTERPSFAQVYELIEEDMLNALELLPDNYSKARIPSETPHKGSAKALLAEIYMAMAGYPVNDESKYAEAARLSGEVIAQSDEYNFHLLDDFANLWDEEYRHNSENIFGLFYDGNSKQTSNTISHTRLSFDRGHSSLYVPESDIVINFSTDVAILTQYIPEIQFYQSFPNNYRKKKSLIMGDYIKKEYVDVDTTTGGLIYIPFSPEIFPCQYTDGVAYLKWVDYKSIEYRKNLNLYESKNTLYLLRYAQTLLTYAEASARSGNLNEASFEAVNKVRRRANHIDLFSPSEFDLRNNLSTEQFLDSVVWERAWELCMEPDGRWFDVIRLDLRNELDNKRYKQDAQIVVDEAFLSEDWYFFKIPQQDRWLNPNFE